MCYDGGSVLTYWVNGSLLHTYTGIPYFSNLDHAEFYIAGGGDLREIAFHFGVKYTQPFTVKQGCRYNAIIHETI